MKLLPIPPLPNLAAPSPFMWGQDLLWRNPYTASNTTSSSSSMSDLKTQLPAQLPTDPRLWGREDVGVFLRFCEREFDLPKFEMDLFQMNGKALCLLTKTDLAKRIPGAGDILHNILDMLVRDAQMLHRHLPNSPITPTSRFLPSSPAHNSHPPTPNWTQLAPPDSPFHSAHLQHFIANSNSVTLSPAPSVDSQVGSPPQNGQQSGSESGSSTSSILQQHHQMHSQALQQQHHAAFFGNMLLNSEMRQAASAASSSSNQSKSDSEDEQQQRSPTSNESLQHQANAAVAVAAAASILAANAQQSEQQAREQKTSPPPQQQHQLVNMKKEPKFLHNLSNIVTTWPQQNGVLSPLPQKYNDDHKSQSAPNTPFALSNGLKNEFFPNDSGEPNTNGRLLWDFLQQLLNDPAQRYSSFIAWKCRDTGVFKIVDPAGLAQLWGIQKNHLSMNYDKMSRALRYYYRVNILRKVQGERHCYQFLRNPTELKNIKNISLLRQQPPPASLTNNQQYNNDHSMSIKQESSSSPTYSNSNSMIPPPSPSAFQTSFHHLTLTQGQLQAAAVAAAAAVHGNHFKFSPPPPTSPVIKSSPSADSSVDMDDMPTDLSTTGSSGERKMGFNQDCYPLIRNSNGLTTIQLVKQQQELRVRQDMTAGGDVPMEDDEYQHQNQRRRPREEEENEEQQDIHEDKRNCSGSSEGQNEEAEIDVTNVSNSNCDLIRHSNEGVPADLRRKYD